MKKAVWMSVGLLALGLSAICLPVVAQENYPLSPIRLVWGYPPGGTGDLSARLIAQKLSAQMNANVFVDNKPGANGNIGAEFVARSRPDGYTLMFNTSPLILSRALGEKLNYDLLKDLAPVTLVATTPQLLVVHPPVPAHNVPEFIAHVRANPEKLAYGSSGTGSITHLATLLFLQSNGLSALHVPYKGGAAANIDLVAGRIQFQIASVGSLAALVKDKRLRALAVTSLKRSPLLPDVPTLAETIPRFEIINWYGVMVPAATPRPIVQRLNSEVVKALRDPDMMLRLLENDALPLGSTPEEYETHLRSELERWSKVIKSAGVRVE